MTAFYIVCGILAFVLLIIFSSVRIKIVYDNCARVHIGFWFFSFRVLPVKQSTKTKKSAEKRKKTEADKKENHNKKSVAVSASEVIDIVKLVLDKLRPVLKSVRIRPLVFNAAVSADDAAQTAITTGVVNSIVWPFAGWLSNTVKVRGLSVSVNPAYENDTGLYFKTCIRIRLNHIISAGIGILAGIYKLKFSKDGAVK